jgi:phage terminase large subunit-like protein
MTKRPRVHPVLRVPPVVPGQYEQWVAMLELRQKKIEAEEAHPMQYGYEPPVWKLADAVTGMPWLGQEEGTGIRAKLGLNRPWSILLIMGANRSSKSQYAARTVMKLLLSKPGAKAWCFHENERNSIDYQQRYVHNYFPPEWKVKAIKTHKAFMSFGLQNGFPDRNFVLPNESSCNFRTYEQDIKKSEGGECDIVWCDELVPVDLVNVLKSRIATRAGWLIITFTAIEGYSGTVKKFQDGARVIRDAPGYLLPAAGKMMDMAKALGVEAGHADELLAWAEKKGNPVDVWSVPERLDDIVVARPPEAGYERVPRVAQCVDEQEGILWYHGRDNPYGNPVQLATLYGKSGADKIKERCYGIALKAMEASFPKFKEEVHVIPPAAIPKDNATIYFFMDPASARNPFMKWFKRTRDKTYLYREWPGNYAIPGATVWETGPGPGPWAVPDGKHSDGAKGPAQKPFGFGLLRIKMEIARLEGWTDWREDVDNIANGKKRKPVIEWRQENGAVELPFRRFIDSRAASSPRVEQDRPVTLLEEMLRMGMDFELTPAFTIAEGKMKINDALDWDSSREMDFINSPKYLISAECRNTIFSYLTWTGDDGNKGACKDPIDLDCYYFLSDLEYVDPKANWVVSGGGVY